jgi:hypothetical protein
MKMGRRQHITIFITIVMTLASSLTILQAPTVKSLGDPHWWYGFVDYQNNSNVSNTRVTFTDVDANNNTMWVDTDAWGFYMADLSEITGSQDGDYIVINCTNNSQVGENASTIDISQPYQWCNLTGGTRLENESLSINVTSWNWAPENLWIGTTNNSNSTSNTYFNLTNQGNVKINVKIHGENITWNGHKWNLTLTPALNNYTLEYQKSGEGSWTNINVTNNSFITNFQYNSQYFSYIYWQEFGLNITMPTLSTADPPELSVDVTFWSIKA